MSTDSYIGVFDSGIGGLTVLKEIHRQLPTADTLYVADSAFAPYGEKRAEQIIQRCFLLTDLLIDKGARIIVVACNTATAYAVNAMREKYSLPVVAMEPAVKPAVAHSRNGKVGILATSMTLASHRYALLLERFAAETEVIEQACPGLVEQIEKLQIDSAETQKLLQTYLQPLLDQQVDALVLGCTHYPLLREQIQAICGESVHVIDTAVAVTQELLRRLPEIGLDPKTSIGHGETRFFTSGDLKPFTAQLQCYWPYPFKPQQLQQIQLS
ncbi:MAG: glutamate racemase [Chromatiales bacterium]